MISLLFKDGKTQIPLSRFLKCSSGALTNGQNYCVSLPCDPDLVEVLIFLLSYYLGITSGMKK